MPPKKKSKLEKKVDDLAERLNLLEHFLDNRIGKEWRNQYA